MKLEYELPIVEIIDFLAMENLAATPEQVEGARDGAARNSDGGGVGGPSIGDGAEEW